MQKHRRKSNGKVLGIQGNFYVSQRFTAAAAPFLRDRPTSPPERLLQAIWQHQRLQRNRLLTLDGKPVRVLHPGFPSLEGGPDFRGAVIQIGSDIPKSGDVEVDVQSAGWVAHRHDRNPAFRNVILQVVWAAVRAAPGVPAVVALQDCLDAPLLELALWLESNPAPELPDLLRGRCCPGLRKLPLESRGRLLRDAAELRFRAKAHQFQARAREAGWEQALWEGLFRGLGYKHNSWPMQCLAELRPQWSAGNPPLLELQARLFGAAGLLPADLPRATAAAGRYLRRIWDFWWRERESYADAALPGSIWRLHGLRPANHPLRRLALAAHWSMAGGLAQRLERWCAVRIPDPRLAGSLLQILDPGPDEFWSWHWTLRTPRLAKPRPLLGATRVTDLAVNAILPWLWARAAEGDNGPVQRLVEHRFRNWPAAEDNSVLRLARFRLLGGAPRRTLSSAAEQQGLIQIGRDYCDRSNATCENCRFPVLVETGYGECGVRSAGCGMMPS
ncbi:MAG: DUF2851 family protein [Verrucomicrobiota bacterium]